MQLNSAYIVGVEPNRPVHRQDRSCDKSWVVRRDKNARSVIRSRAKRSGVSQKMDDCRGKSTH